MENEDKDCCQKCQRKLLSWAVVRPTGAFERFTTCSKYCDKRCHMCGEKLRVRNSKNFKRSVKCTACAWEDTTTALPFYPMAKSKKTFETRKNVSTSRDNLGYQRLTAEEMRTRHIPRVISSPSYTCGSCGVSVSINGTCRCS